MQMRAIALLVFFSAAIISRGDLVLPFQEALDFMKQAECISLYYIPPIADEHPSQANRRTWRRATAEQKGQLLGIFTRPENYFSGTWSVSEGPATDHIRIEFQKGKDKLTLTCGLAILEGKFQGKTIQGLLTGAAPMELHKLRKAFSEAELR